MQKPRIRVDFNEMVEPDLVLLSKTDTCVDSEGNNIDLDVGLEIDIYMTDVNDNGVRDNLVATGMVETNTFKGWGKCVKWCCRISDEGIRHESDIQ